MTLCFHSLIHRPKIKRWLKILALLEEKEQTTAAYLSELTQCSKRTIHKDLKEIKQYFKNEVMITGDDHGIHFAFRAPNEYTKKVQALIEDEPFLLLLARFFDDRPTSNQELAAMLGVSLATFNRLKRDCSILLNTNYGLRIDAHSNTLLGSERAIRQAMFDFFCTLPLYPKQLESTVAPFRSKTTTISSSRWNLDHALINQWAAIVKIRTEQGHVLPEHRTAGELQTVLAREWEKETKIHFPEREQAALFVLCLSETSFYDPLYQKEFLHYFLPLIPRRFMAEIEEPELAQLFRLVIFLLTQFVGLPQAVLKEARKRKIVPEEYLFDHFMHRYIQVVEEVKKTVFLTYDLTGSQAIKRWIKQEVAAYFKAKGWTICPTSQATIPSSIRHLTITNRVSTNSNPSVIHLSSVPSTNEVGDILAKLEK